MLSNGSALAFFIDFLDTASTLYLTLLMMWFLYKLLTPKKPVRFLTWKVLAIALIYDVFSQQLGFAKVYDFFYLMMVIIPILPLIIYSLLFLKGSVIEKLLASIATMIIYNIISTSFVILWMILGYSVESMHNSAAIYISSIIITHLLMLPIYILIAKAYKKLTLNLNKKQTLLIMVIAVFTFIFLLIVTYITTVINDSSIRTFLLISTVCLAIAYGIIFYLIKNISRSNKIESENAILKIEKDYQKQKYEDIIQQSEQIKKLRHDYKNNLLVIRSLAENNDFEKIAEFVSNGIELINSTKTHIKTNNEVINAIVNTKISASLTQGIKVNFISISDFDGIDDFDLCNLISNLFDNAITAVSNCENKIIEIKIAKKDDLYTIKVSNTISESVLKTNPELITTKSNHINHGYGIKIIKDIADKYNGEIDYYEEEGMFYFLVHLLAKPQIESAVPVLNKG